MASVSGIVTSRDRSGQTRRRRALNRIQFVLVGWGRGPAPNAARAE